MNRISVWGLLILVFLAASLFVAHKQFSLQRDRCGQQLVQLIPKLDVYAQNHSGQLPASLDELRQAVGMLPVPINEDAQFLMSNRQLRWKSTDAPEPFLWESRAHTFVGGIHVLYSDGSVRLDQSVPLPRRYEN